MFNFNIGHYYGNCPTQNGVSYRVHMLLANNIDL